MLSIRMNKHIVVVNQILPTHYSDIRSDDDNFILLFYNYLALKEEDEKACIHVKAGLMGLKPNHTTSEGGFYHRHMKLFAQKLDEAITRYIKEIYSDEIICFFFSIDSEYQWICASIIAEKIKDLYSGSTVVIGGIKYKKTAAEYFQMFVQFDFAVWGGTEKTLLGLCKYLVEENQAYENIPHLAFRQNNAVLTLPATSMPNDSTQVNKNDSIQTPSVPKTTPKHTVSGGVKYEPDKSTTVKGSYTVTAGKLTAGVEAGWNTRTGGYGGVTMSYTFGGKNK
jgi:hypothetical protein